MDYAEKKSGEGLARPAASQSTLVDAATVAPAQPSGFDNHTAQNALQAPHATASTYPLAPLANGAPAHAQHPAWGYIPQEMRELEQWVIAGPDKSPWSTGGYRASVTDPEGWTDFYSAGVVAGDWGASHVGFIISARDPFVCIDLDVKDAETHPDKPEVWTTQQELARYHKIIQSFNSYTEYSRSGKGFHIWVRGSIGLGCKHEGVEVYSQERFIICTGNVYLNAPISERQDMVELLVSEIRQKQGAHVKTELVEVAEELTDLELWNRASTAVNADKFLALWNGQWQGEYPSQSEADLSLMSMLTFYSKSNEQCRRMFRLCALGQRTKATKNDYYLNNTLKLIRGRMEQEAPSLEHGRREALSIMAASANIAKTAETSMGAHFKDKSAGVPTPAEVAAKQEAEFSARIPRDLLSKPVPKPFELDEAPPPIANFAHAFSLATGNDHSGLIVAATTAAASIIDDRFQLEVNPGSRWVVSARLWSFLCAPPSGGKSPTLRPATDPIKDLHKELYANWERENAGAEKGKETPIPALFTSDTNVPALSIRLKDNPRGMLMHTEEFASWIGAIDCADKGDAAKNRGDWLQLRDGGSRQIDRVGRGYTLVPNWGASVLAACTPDGLAKQMRKMPEDGLIQRFIPCIMGPRNLDAEGDYSAAYALWEATIRWTYQFTSVHQHQTVRFSPEARAMFKVEEKEQQKLTMATESMAPAFASHMGKHPGMLAEVALTFHVFSGRPVGTEIDVETMSYAIRFMRRVRKHAYYLYSAILATSPAFDLAQAIARSIVAVDKPIATINREWMTQHANGFRNADDRLRQSALEILQDADWITTFSGSGTYKSNPRAYAVHPKVFQLFAREGEMHRARRAAVAELIKERN